MRIPRWYRSLLYIKPYLPQMYAFFDVFNNMCPRKKLACRGTELSSTGTFLFLVAPREVEDDWLMFVVEFEWLLRL